MKKVYIIMMAAAALLCATVASCGLQDIEPRPEKGNGVLDVSFCLDCVATKAASSTAEWDGDETIKTIQLSLFEKTSGARVASYRFENTAASMSAAGVTLSGGVYTKTFSSLSVGTYVAAVLVNQPEVDASTLSAITGTASAQIITLSSSAIARKSGTAANGMPGYGSAEVSVTSANTASSPATAAVTVTKLPFRVMLKSLVTNIPYGTPTVDINCAYLSNAIMSWTISGAGTPSGMANKAGRQGSTKMSVIGDSEAAYRDWTVRDISVTGVGNSYTLPDAKKGGFYAFPNAVTAANDAFNGAFTAESTERTRLVIAASWNGTPCWYPVTIPSPQRGYSYDVSVTITGPGSDDPNKPVVHGSLSVEITVSPWVGGEEIVETY